MISERSAAAYKAIATKGYPKVYDIPASASAAHFDGSIADPSDVLEIVRDAVKAGEHLTAVSVVDGDREYVMIVSDEHVIDLF